MLDKFARRAGLDQLAAHAACEAHPLTLHVGAGGAPDLQRLRVVAKLDTDLVQDRFRIALDQRQAFLVQHFVVRNLARDIRHRDAAARQARRALGIAAARAAGVRNCRVFAHRGSPFQMRIGQRCAVR